MTTSAPGRALSSRMKPVLLALAVLAALGTRAVAQEDCQQLVEEAKRAYVEGNLDRVLALTSGCVVDRATSENANALRARTFVALDRTDEAEKAVTALLRVNPQFSPGSDDTRRFAALVARMKREFAKSATSSVSKMNESLLETPATVVVVTADQIKRRGYLDLEAVLHDLPGFDISRTNGQNYSNIYQRGYRSDATNRTLFIVDGVEQNDLYSNIAYISRQYPLSNIDRIEVVYGPASTMYGANAFLGVINVITKDPEDFIGEGRSSGAEVQIGGGAWNTKLVDASVAGRFRDATFSLTGRAYVSDEYDLSQYTTWRYSPTVFSSAGAQYAAVLPAHDNDPNSSTYLDFFVPTATGISRAMAFDQAAFAQSLGGVPLHYSNLTDDWMLSGKLKVSNFLVGFQAWRTREGAASSATASKEPGADNGNIWVPYQTSAYVRYNSALSGNLTLSYSGQAKVHGLGRGSASFTLYNYLFGPLNINDLVKNVQPYWAETLLQQSSNQFRNELNLIYRFKDRLSLVGGVDLRNGSIQGDYAKATNCAPPPASPFQDFTPAASAKLVDRSLNFADLFYPFVDRLVALLDGDPRAQPRCTLKSDTTPPPITSGGEHFAVRNTGLFAQASYKPIPTLKFVGGLRLDHDTVDPGAGFGTVANPRLGVIYSLRGLVFKTIYSEAFKDPSSLEKFSIIPGIRDVQSPQLRPERARNLEMSAGRQWPGFSADVAVYRTAYSDLISLRNRNVANYPAICVRDSSGNCTTGAAEDALVGTLNWLNSPSGSTAEATAANQLVRLFGNLAAKTFDYFFNAPLVTGQYTNTGAMRVWGLQASMAGQLRGVDVFGNYTYSSPYNVAPVDEFGDPLQGVARLRVADIASHHINLGAANRWGKFDGSLRVNYVGERPTGPGTTVAESPLSKMKPYAIASTTIGYEVRPGVTAQLIVNDIFNTRYNDPGVGTADGLRFAASVPQPGRSLFVRLLARF